MFYPRTKMEEKDEEFGTMEIVKAIGVVAAVGLELGVPISFSVLVTVKTRGKQ